MSAALDMPDVDNVPGVQSICTWLPRYYICTLPPADASPSITVLPPQAFALTPQQPDAHFSAPFHQSAFLCLDGKEQIAHVGLDVLLKTRPFTARMLCFVITGIHDGFATKEIPERPVDLVVVLMSWHSTTANVIGLCQGSAVKGRSASPSIQAASQKQAARKHISHIYTLFMRMSRTG